MRVCVASLTWARRVRGEFRSGFDDRFMFYADASACVTPQAQLYFYHRWSAKIFFFFCLVFLTFILFRFSDVERGRQWGWVFPSEMQWTQTKKSPRLPYSLLKYWFDHNILAHPALHRMYEQHCTSIYNQIFLSHKRRLCTFPPACFRRTAPFFFLFCTEGQEIRTKAKRCREVELQPQSSKVCLAR